MAIIIPRKQGTKKHELLELESYRPCSMCGAPVRDDFQGLRNHGSLCTACFLYPESKFVEGFIQRKCSARG